MPNVAILRIPYANEGQEALATQAAAQVKVVSFDVKGCIRKEALS